MATSCNAGSLTVEAVFDPSLVQIIDCSVDSEEIAVGDTFRIDFTVANDNEMDAEFLGAAVLNGSRGTEYAFTVGAQSETEEWIEVDGTEAGEIDVGVEIFDRVEA